MDSKNTNPLCNQKFDMWTNQLRYEGPCSICCGGLTSRYNQAELPCVCVGGDWLWVVCQDNLSLAHFEAKGDDIFFYRLHCQNLLPIHMSTLAGEIIHKLQFICSKVGAWYTTTFSWFCNKYVNKWTEIYF